MMIKIGDILKHVKAGYPDKEYIVYKYDTYHWSYNNRFGKPETDKSKEWYAIESINGKPICNGEVQIVTSTPKKIGICDLKITDRCKSCGKKLLKLTQRFCQSCGKPNSNLE